ncbi:MULTISPECIES: hypothetical protein [unclassified Pseudoxanthomonas]|uniref:hypothetical protein n=1 Tax=unclassified Pseudoxanthomonas TaxID=2645906 RepID=UPI00161C13AB|nr:MULTISPECIES: hypothetical protein [unclassified Pseudoxanthomonas]MBB3274839.1 hypothetical protein [Pseudoxanthomonas sp. OG2]MBV7475268.1 hypothetical protein [Pseudoxanthomonas sp. PXM05]
MQGHSGYVGLTGDGSIWRIVSVGCTWQQWRFAFDEPDTQGFGFVAGIYDGALRGQQFEQHPVKQAYGDGRSTLFASCGIHPPMRPSDQQHSQHHPALRSSIGRF